MIAVLLIGDEILAGQVEEQNLKYILKTFSVTGHNVSEVRIVNDDINQIKIALKELSARHDHVVTSGGVGPTHDDVTISAVAKAFDRGLQRDKDLEKSLKDYYKDDITDEALSMADIPENSELIDKGGSNWPILKVENCYILPGVPQIFKQKFDRLVHFLPIVDTYFIAKLFVRSDEIFFAKKLNEINNAYLDVILGSYPIFGDPSYNTEITIKNTKIELVQEVFDILKKFFEEIDAYCFSNEPQKI